MLQRLKSDIIIEKVFKEGKTLFRYPIKLVYLRMPLDVPHGNMYSGVSVSKRNFKRAVDRNRVKRQLREAIRLNYKIVDLDSSSISIMVIFVSKEKLEYDVIEKTIYKLIQKIKA